jgi:conjugative relaxase-like TrwC/TraI family protein
MLRITDSASVQGAKEYFDASLRQADYYAEGQEIVGRWHGLAAARLGLEGSVSREAFQSLIDNRHPATGEQLTPRQKADRRPGTDFTFNAPKSVSLLYALHRDERIVEGFRAAVTATMAEIEKDVMTRVRAHGANEDRMTGNFAWAEFLHTTARPVGGVPDPHLHIHAYVPNLTFDEAEGRWKAIQLGSIKGDGAYYEAAFLSRLAIEMRALGYEIERHGRYWDVGGVPRDLLERFSRRTAEIERMAAEQGVTDAKRKGDVGARTRERKAESLSLSDLRDVWISRLGPKDRKALDLAAATAEASPLPRLGLGKDEAVAHALAHGFERGSVVAERSLLTSALHHAYGDAGPETIRRALDRQPLIRRKVEGRMLVSTPEVLAEETAMLAFAREGRLTCRPLGAADYRIDAGALSAEQCRAVRQILASPDRLTILRGGAGTGKTTLMREAVHGIEASGLRANVFAPTSAARDVLRNEGFATAETLQRLLVDTEMQASVKGAALWIDEAGLVSAPDMGRLLRIADAQHCRVVLSGDSRQHGSVGRGDALRLLETHSGIRPAEVRSIVRQSGRYRDAVADIAAGKPRDAFARFEAMGAIIEEPGENRFTRLAADYAAETRAGRSVLVVSPTHREKDAATRHIRETLHARGALGGEVHHIPVLHDLRWTQAERADAGRYAGGEIIVFNQNAPGHLKGTRGEVVHDAADALRLSGPEGMCDLPLHAAARFTVYRPDILELRPGDTIRITANGATLDGHRLVNGAIYHVGAFDPKGNLVLKENGWRVAQTFGHLDHGYCVTSISSQGRTVDTVLVAMGRESIPAASQEQFYVSASRGRHAMRLYTDDRDAVRDAVAHSGARGSATELQSGAVDGKGAPIARQERLKDYVHTAARLCAARAHAERGRQAETPPTSLASIDYQGTLQRDAQEARR